MNGEKLTSQKVVKILTEVAMRNGILLHCEKGADSLQELLDFCVGDTLFSQTLAATLAKGKKAKVGETWWPTQVWISRFMLKYNLSYGSISTSMYSRSAYLFQLQPCLEFTYALGKAFGVPVGVGRILNADEVMCYKYTPSTRTWHV